MATLEELNISYTARDFETIRDELEAHVLKTRPALWSDFFQSNLGTALIELVSLVGDMLSYGQDITASEVFLSTARRYDSALRFARSVGYTPRSAVATEARVTSVSHPSTLVTNGGTVPAGSQIQGANGLNYELLDDVTINPGATISTLTLFEGTTLSQEFENSNQPSQQITTDAGIVAQDSWDVYVGDTANPNNLWTQVDSIELEESATETYEVTFDGEGRLVVTFGDGGAGKIPDDRITVHYRTTNGAEGNTPILGVRGAVTVTVAGGFGTVNVTYENANDPAAGGEDRESLAELKVNIPAFLRSADKILTLDDYNRNVPRVAGVALAAATPVDSSYNGNSVSVNAWGEELVTFTGESDTTLLSEVDYTRYAQLSVILANEIQQFLAPRTPLTVHNIVNRPEVAFADIYLSEVTYDRRFRADTVHANVTKAVVAVFENSSGFAIRIARLYDAIRDAEGISHFFIERVVFERDEQVNATGSVVFDSNTQPTDGETVTIDDGTNLVVYEFDDDVSVTPGNVLVTIGGTIADTRDNLINAINANNDIIAAPDDTATDATVLLTQTKPGAIYNIAILEAAVAITVVGMAGGSDTPTTKTTDYRRVQSPTEDAWPPGAYTPGAPFTAGVWADGGILPYEKIQDLEIRVASEKRYYDETYLYNNEILYDSELVLADLVQAIILRRLKFDLIPE